MTRPRTVRGQHGNVSYRRVGKQTVARTEMHDLDGLSRDVERSGKNQSLALLALEEACRPENRPKGHRLNSATITKNTRLGEATEFWLSEVQASSKSTNTKRGYSNAAKNHVINGPLANLFVDEVGVVDFKVVLTGLAAIKPAMMDIVRAVYRGTMDKAVEDKAIPSNPVRNVSFIEKPRKPGVPAKGRDTGRALTSAERKELVKILMADERSATHSLVEIVMFMNATGCRIGEACAMRWSKLDLLAGTALIGATNVRIKGMGMQIQEDTKGHRDHTARLPLWEVDRLRAYHKRANHNEYDLLFLAPRGGPLCPNSVTDCMREVLGDRFDWMTSHTLRRTVVTLMDDANLSPRKQVNQLGSADQRSLDPYRERRAIVEEAATILTDPLAS